VDELSTPLLTALWVPALAVAWIWRPRQPATLGAWLMLAAFGVLGGWALWAGLYAQPGEPPGFIFWKPTVLYWTLAAILIVSPVLGGGYPVKIILGTYFALSTREWRWLNRGFGAVYAILGGVNLWVASEASYKDWVGFKYGCLMNMLIIVLLRLNFVWLPILADVSIYLYRRATAAYRAVASLF
jgi:intracellular septation protein